MKYGGDYLGATHFEDAMLKAHKPGDCAGIFYRTFPKPGKPTAKDTVIKMCKSGKFSEIVVHLAPFDNSHSYPISNLRSQVLNDSRELSKIQTLYAGTRLMLSPFCENNHAAKDLIPLFDKMKKMAPNCLMVNSSMKGVVIPGVILEIHLTDSRSLPRIPSGDYTVSFDGFGGGGKGDFSDADIPEILRNYATARHIRWWDFRCNGKSNHEDDTSIPNRKTWPDERYIKSRRAQMKTREGAKTWTKGLYKNVADDHGNPEPTKDNKALVIIPRGGSSIDVLDSRGKKIDTMLRSPLGDSPDGPRYYSKKFNFELGDLAQRNTGSRQIKIRSGSEIYPLTDADLRSNKFK